MYKSRILPPAAQPLADLVSDPFGLVADGCEEVRFFPGSGTSQSCYRAECMRGGRVYREVWGEKAEALWSAAGGEILQ